MNEVRAPSEVELEEVTPRELADSELALSPFKAAEWCSLSPAERLERAWALRRRLLDPEEVHDRKLFPAP